MTRDQPDLRQTQTTKSQKQTDKENLGETAKTRRPETRDQETTTPTSAATPLTKDHTIQPQDTEWRLK